MVQKKCTTNQTNGKQGLKETWAAISVEKSRLTASKRGEKDKKEIRMDFHAFFNKFMDVKLVFAFKNAPRKFKKDTFEDQIIYLSKKGIFFVDFRLFFSWFF